MRARFILRFGRPKVANFTPEDQKFEIGKAVVLTEGTDVTIIATGHLVWEALQAAEELEGKGISAEVINIHTIKPLDEEAILKSVKKTGCVVTAEEHNFLGGLGESVARTLNFEPSCTTGIRCYKGYLWRKRNPGAANG
jgi:transketolase